MRSSIALFTVVLTQLVRAEDGPPPRVLCDPSNPALGCPGADCPCVPDGLDIVFADGRSVLDLGPFVADTTFAIHVLMDARTDGIEGWSFGVEHDEVVLDVLRVDIRPDLCLDEFPYETCYQGDIRTCTRGSERGRCLESAPGGGWIFATVLSIHEPVTLPLGRQQIATAAYRLETDPLEVGTAIRFSNRLFRAGTPLTDLNLTISGRSRLWSQATDGLVRTAPSPFRRGDANGDLGRDVSDPIAILSALFDGGARPPCEDAADANDDGGVDVSDAIFILAHLFWGGEEPPPPLSECSGDPTPDALGCAVPAC